MSKANSWESGCVRLVLLNSDFTLLGDAGGLRGSAAAGTIYISLHTADPGEAGDQTTSETTYGGYARLGVARTGAEWTESGGVGSNLNVQLFPACVTGSATLTHFGIGTAASGAGKLLYSGALTTPLSVTSSPSVQPRCPIASISVTET